MRVSADTAHNAAHNGQEDRRSRPMLTRDDTAAYLAVSKRTLDRLVQAGEIPAYRIGGHRRFRIEDIDSFVASKME
jgi:excisionase family DNA binding protein